MGTLEPMLDDNFMDVLLGKMVHSARTSGLVEFKGDHMVAEIQKEYDLDEASAEAELNGWLTSRGGWLEGREYDFGPPKGSMVRTAASTGYERVAILPDAAVREASPRASAIISPE
jgi:hypothetical protein